MSVQSWAAHWRDALVAERRREEPAAFTGAQSMQLAQLTPGPDANPDARVELEHGVLALFDEGRREVLLAAVPVWSGGLWVPSNAKEQQRLTASIEAAAERNGLGIAVLAGPDGARRTVYTRAVPLGEPWLEASEPAWQFSIGIGGFTEPGTARAQDFTDAVARAARAFLADDAYPVAQDSAAGTRAANTPAVGLGAGAPERPETPLAPPPAPAAGSGDGESERQRGDRSAGVAAAAGTRSVRPASRRIAAIAGATLAIALLGVLGIVGVSRGYPVEVVDQEARAETFVDMPTGEFDLVEQEGEQICGDREVYQWCVDQHAALYAANCETFELTASARELCDSLDHFVSDSQRKSDECGENCYTAIDEDGLWGWSQLRAVPETERVSNGDGLERIAHTEYCRFDLGPIRIGTCPR